MIENKKPEIVEEDDNVSEKDNSKFLKIGTLIIGSILFLMIVCLVMIFILENL